MYKLVVLAAVLAVAAAKPAPGLLAYSGVPALHSGVIAASPLAYSAYSAPAIAAPLAYSAPVAVAAPVAAPVAYSVPAAHSYVSGYNVAVHAEPVEQHGYKIAY
ncbi:vitelline membrane protein Vm26Ab-like [Thrips palmi]|uniref:Vitelline membrane protein Vm26Ab-like n=1 Tax=Thrips palmi TaxID=161013 RepID=A0A6P8ZYA2_THRPL|nr:vitelline membrane protein Vm26Ab-like [Thrips palmi]